MPLINFAWSKRGWTFQEDITSRRGLYFTNTTSFFRCQTHRCVEQDTITYPNVRNWQAVLYFLSLNMEKKRLHNIWDALVVTYTGQRLTKGLDKLPALSGFARMFSQASEDEYLAGIWRQECHRGMLWYTFRSVAEPTGWRAPSWSWASWDGIVEMLPQAGEPLKSQITLVDAHVVPSGPDPFGILRDGWLLIMARIRPVAVKFTDRDRYDTMTWYANILDENGAVVSYGSLDLIPCSGWAIDASFKPAPLQEITHFKDVSALLVALTCQYSPEGDGEGNKEWPDLSFAAGILITPAGRGVYRRVGIFYSVGLPLGCSSSFWDGIATSRVKLIRGESVDSYLGLQPEGYTGC